MIEPGIGRLLVGSLHGAISDVLPKRLEFYEEWFRPAELRDGHIGRAPLGAVLSFLRHEGEAYDQVMRQAGTVTATWWVETWSPVLRALMVRMPTWLRGRLAIREARRLMRHTFRETNVSGRWRQGGGHLTLDHSLFCEVRERVSHPLCGFYAAAVETLFAELRLPVTVSLSTCRAVDGASCTLTLARQAGEAA